MRNLKMVAAILLLVILLTGVEIFIVRSASRYEPEVEVVFAKQRIPQKTEITPDMLEVRKIGVGLAHRLSVKKTGEAAGKKAVMDIESGEMLLSSKLGLDEMQQIEVKDKNKRLFSVEFKGDQANGWWVLVDQYVDILFIPNETYGNPALSDSPRDDGQESNRQEPSLQDSVSQESVSQNRVRQSGGTDALTSASQDEKYSGGTADGTISRMPAINEWIPAGAALLEKIRIAALIDERGQLLGNNDRVTLPRYISFEVTDRQAEFLAAVKSRGRLELSVVPEE